tara:strand:+ start:12841 stop:13164 length:324 start_codon:yes stop_codon:yes gene_type:complete
MGKGIGVILIIVIVLFTMTYFREGSGGLQKDTIAQSTFESGGIAFEKGKELVEQGSETFNEFNQDEETSLIEIGMIPCATSKECNELVSQCIDDSCVCQEGICWKEG